MKQYGLSVQFSNHLIYLVALTKIYTYAGVNGYLFKQTKIYTHLEEDCMIMLTF